MNDLFNQQVANLQAAHFLVLYWVAAAEDKRMRYNITHCFDDLKFRSITRTTVPDGLGVAFNNCTEPLEPLQFAANGPVEVRVLRGPAVLVRDNDPRIIPMRDGHAFVVSLATEHARVLGLAALRCQRCRKADGSAFNPH